MLGDNLAKLNATGKELLRRVLNAPPLSRAAVPLDMFKGHDRAPALLLAEEKGFWALGVFNWDENAADISIALDELRILKYRSMESFFDGNHQEPNRDRLAFKLPPRSCKGFLFWK